MYRQPVPGHVRGTLQWHRRTWLVSVLCDVLGVSPGGYQQYFVWRAQGNKRRHIDDDATLVHIKAIRPRSHGSYAGLGYGRGPLRSISGSRRQD